MLDLQPIKDRLAAATPGPWEVEPSETVEGSFIASLGPIMVVPYFQSTAPMMDDAVLIAHARTDLNDLVAEVERLRAAIEDHRYDSALRSLWAHDHRLWAVLDA